MNDAMIATATPGMGHNVGIAPAAQQVRDNIEERYKYMKPRSAELLATVEKVPEVIAEEEIGKVADLVKAIGVQVKQLDTARTAEKEPHLEAGRTVDGIFKNMIEPLKAAADKLKRRLGIAQEKKEAKARKAAEERAAAEREAAEQRRREAEQKAREEQARLEEQNRLAREAEAERQRAAAERQRIAAEAARKHQEEMARIEADRRAAEDRRLAAEREAAEAGRKKDEEVRLAKEAEKEAQRQARLAEEAADQRKREAEKAAKAQEREAALAAEEEDRKRRQAVRDSARATKDLAAAVSKENTAIAKETKIENASPAEFSRTRGDFGALATQSKFWTFANVDRDILDLEKLRYHLPMDGIEKAIRSLIDAGEHELLGADIFEDNRTQVR